MLAVLLSYARRATDTPPGLVAMFALTVAAVALAIVLLVHAVGSGTPLAGASWS